MNAILSDAEWLADYWRDLPSSMRLDLPSVVAEKYRYIPASTSDNSGPFRWDLAPYFREPLDCLAPDAPYHTVCVKKGVQMGATVCLLENLVLYYMREVKTRPVLFATADEGLALKRLNTNIVPMIQASGLADLIASNDHLSAKKQGKTDKFLEWVGGGWMAIQGAKNPNSLRSLPFPVLLLDEVDGWDPTTRDGDPLKIALARGKTYKKNGVLKALILSTPTTKTLSKVEPMFLLGDQRDYFICCLKCGGAQRLRWRRVNKETGEETGVLWDTINGIIDPTSVRYHCKFCSHPHEEDDKYKLISPNHGAEWRSMVEAPKDPGIASFNAPALISIMQSWYDWALDYQEAMGSDPAQPTDPEKLRVFYNNCLAETFEPRGRGVTQHEVNSHKRTEYAMTQVPDAYAKRATGSNILMLTAAVDVHTDALYFAVFGWTRGLRCFLVDYRRFPDSDKTPGDTSRLDDPATWGTLAGVLERETWQDQAGNEYQPGIVLVDSSWLADTVYGFCAQFPGCPIFPVQGKPHPGEQQGGIAPFRQYHTPMNTAAWTVIVDLYKDRWSHSLRRYWIEGEGFQPLGHFNAPINISEKALKELTAERKVPRVNAQGQTKLVWFRPRGSHNELWDLLMYSTAGLEIMCYLVCKHQLELEKAHWPAFWDYLEAQRAA